MHQFNLTVPWSNYLDMEDLALSERMLSAPWFKPNFASILFAASQH